MGGEVRGVEADVGTAAIAVGGEIFAGTISVGLAIIRKRNYHVKYVSQRISIMHIVIDLTL